MMAQVTVNMVTRELRYAKLTAQATVTNSQESSGGPRSGSCHCNYGHRRAQVESSFLSLTAENL
jgi:hypothetical protein